jgi:GNAT superfamily N-acetyltransferase
VPPRIRAARLDEVGELNALIERSARELSRGFYTPAETESLIRHVFGVDTQLVRDGSYFAVEVDGRIVACGGWSDRRTLFGGDQTKGAADPKLDPHSEPARIRAFFVHPAAARQGLGTLLLAHCENAARGAGFLRTELMATLPGVPFYERAGYRALESVSHPMPDGTQAPFVRMGHSF